MEGDVAEGGREIPEADANEMLDRVVDRIRIKGGLDINQLKQSGTVFEIDEDAVAVRLMGWEGWWRTLFRNQCGRLQTKTLDNRSTFPVVTPCLRISFLKCLMTTEAPPITSS